MAGWAPHLCGPFGSRIRDEVRNFRPVAIANGVDDEKQAGSRSAAWHWLFGRSTMRLGVGGSRSTVGRTRLG